MLSYLSNIQQSYSVAFADFVRSKEAEGLKIIKMQTGDPDFDTHSSIVRAAEKAMEAGETKYCDSKGLLSLRVALENKLLTENKIKASAQDHILITHGAIHAISIVIKALVNPGDECIILEPYWRAYESNVVLSGGVPVFIPTQHKEFQLDPALVLEKVTEATKLIVINSPNNPSGIVYRREQLRTLASEAAKKGIYIISDEVYEAITFGANEHYSMAADPEVFDWVISIFSFSKTHAMTGWRIGYIVATKAIIDELLKLSQFSITSLSPYNQQGALVALTNPDARAYTMHMVKEYEERKNFIFTIIKGTWLEDTCVIPQGTFYVLIDISRFGLASLDLAKKIVDISSISFTPGIAFGESMDHYLRMCFATTVENIEKALNSLIYLEKNAL